MTIKGRYPLSGKCHLTLIEGQWSTCISPVWKKYFWIESYIYFCHLISFDDYKHTLQSGNLVEGFIIKKKIICFWSTFGNKFQIYGHLNMLKSNLLIKAFFEVVFFVLCSGYICPILMYDFYCSVFTHFLSIFMIIKTVEVLLWLNMSSVSYPHVNICDVYISLYKWYLLGWISR